MLEQLTFYHWTNIALVLGFLWMVVHPSAKPPVATCVVVTIVCLIGGYHYTGRIPSYTLDAVLEFVMAAEWAIAGIQRYRSVGLWPL